MERERVSGIIIYCATALMLLVFVLACIPASITGLSLQEYIIPIAVAVAVCCLCCVIHAFITSPATKTLFAKETETFEDRLMRSGFHISKKVAMGNATLYVDDEEKQWALKVDKRQTIKKYKFEDLLEYEIFEDGGSIVSGKTGGAIVGGMLFGTAGSVIGSAGKRSVEETCKLLQLQITVNDLEQPSITADLINSPVTKGGGIYQKLRREVHNFIATLGYIKANKQDA